MARRFGIGWLFAAALVPGILAGSVLFYDIYRHERKQLEEGALQTARALSQVIDKDLAGIRGKLQILAGAPSLQTGDLRAFYSLAKDVLATESLAAAIVLIEQDGQQVINTLRPFGSELPRTGHPEVVRRTFETVQPRISDLYIGGVTRQPFVALEVPVKRGDKVIYALDMGIPAERLNQLLLDQSIPVGWTAALLDSQGKVVARTLNPAQTVGKKAIPDLLAQMMKANEGTIASRNLEGLPSFLAFSRSTASGWTVVVGMSRDVLHGNLYRPLALAGLTMVAFLLGGALLAWRFSRHVRDALKGLGTATEAAAGNLDVAVPVSGLREIAHVAEKFNRMQEARRSAEAEQKRLHRTLQLLSESNSALLHADSEEQLLPEICRLIVEKGGYLMAWVGLAENDAEKSVRPVAQSGYEEGYLDSIRVTWADDELGRGPTGTAIRTGQTQVNQNVLTNPRLRPWRKAAIERGYQSSIALPVAIDGTVVGALTIYAAEPEAFGDEEIVLLEKLAENLAFGIGRLRTRTQLAIANRELQGFTYAASHDMKAPLTRIVNFSALLERNYRDRLEGDGVLFLDFIRQNAKRMMALVEDLLEHAQIEQQVLHLEAVDLTRAVQSILDEKADDIREAGAQMRLDLPAVRVLGNGLGLAQVLRNLLQNALKYSARATPPVVEIGGRAEDGICRLWVRDNGMGFDMTYHDRIFEIFRRLHTYAEIPGSGVGLALVKKAMERMGGRVWAESEPEKGATFFIELPLAKEIPPADEADLPAESPALENR